MYTDEELDQLEQEEHDLTEEIILAMLVILASLSHELKKELRSFYQEYGKDGVITYREARKWVSDADHRRRWTVLLLFLNDNFTALQDELTPHFDSLLRSIIDKESKFFNVDVDADDLINAGWGAGDLNWITRLDDDVDLWLYNVSKTIKQDMVRQQHIDDVLDDIDQRFDSMEKVLRKLTLSESTAMGSMARREIFKELGIKKYQFYAREDECTCDECGALHGLIFPMSAYEVGVTASPIHPHCRCWEVPIQE
jgi:SPP1 gp7 family putative phage head morphogenesis protein